MTWSHFLGPPEGEKQDDDGDSDDDVDNDDDDVNDDNEGVNDDGEGVVCCFFEQTRKLSVSK